MLLSSNVSVPFGVLSLLMRLHASHLLILMRQRAFI